MEKAFVAFCFYVCACLCGPCSAQRRAVPDYLVPKNVYKLDSKWCPPGQLPQRNDSVCCFPVACSKEYEVEPCSFNGTDDQCVQCQPNYTQPNNVSSLNMAEASCFTKQPGDSVCPKGNFKPYRHSVDKEFNWPCVCMSENCWIRSISTLCIRLKTVCGINQQLNASTKQCEQCPWYAYKNEIGCHSCTINITLLREGSSRNTPYQPLITQLSIPTTNGMHPGAESPKHVTDPVAGITTFTTEPITVRPMKSTDYNSFLAVTIGSVVGSLLFAVAIVVLIVRLKRYLSRKCDTRDSSASDQEGASLIPCSSPTTVVHFQTITGSGKPDTQDVLAHPVSNGINSANTNNHYCSWGQQDKPTARVGPLMASPASTDTTYTTILDAFDHERNTDNSMYSMASYPMVHQSLFYDSRVASSIGDFSSLVTQGSISMAIEQRINDVDQSMEQEAHESREGDGFCDYDSERSRSPVLLNQLNNLASCSKMGSLSASVIDNNMVPDVICTDRFLSLSPQPACEMDNDGISRFNSVLPLQRPRPEGQSLSLSNTNNRLIVGGPSQWNTMRKQVETFGETFPKTVENDHTFRKALNVKADEDDEIDENSDDFDDVKYAGNSQDSYEQKPGA